MNCIYEYVKDKHGHRKGVVCAVARGKIGWSSCNIKMGDKFNDELGLKIAIGRAEKGTEAITPNSIRKYLKKMKERSKRYFKK